MSRPSMQRPVMDPLFLQAIETSKSPRHRRLAAVGRVLHWIAKQLLSNPLRLRKNRVKVDREPRSHRLLLSIGYRLLFAPVILALIACALVYSGTHPPRPAAGATTADPSSFDLYYAPVDFQSDDGVQLTGWMVPVVDARRVMLHKDRLLHQTYPAVVLAHDFGQSPQQMLPLIAPLHEDGIVVLAIGLRGTGMPRTVSQTFGLDEAGDILAAVNLLRGRRFVDPTRIAVIGAGTGANAAVLAAERDAKISGIVLLDPIKNSSEVVTQRLGPNRAGLRWLQPLSKWAFQLTYKHDLDDISLAQHQSMLKMRPNLQLDNALTEGRILIGTTDRIREFCKQSLRPWER